MSRGVGGGGRAARVVLAAVLAIGAAAFAAGPDDVRVRALVDRSEIGADEDLRLTVEVVGSNLENVGPPDMSNLGDFDMSAGPAVSTRYQWINGVSSSSRTYTYGLTPKSTGRLTVPALTLLVQGRTYRTQPIEVTVVPRGTVRSPYGSPPPQPPQRGAGPQAGGPSSRAPGKPAALRARVELDARTVYVGQQVTLRFLLDTQTEVLPPIEVPENPAFPGFWTEVIKLPEDAEIRPISIDGQPWSEITIMKRALFPTTTGTLTVPPMALQVRVRRHGNDPFESFFFTPTETVTRRSDPVSVQVLPLPAAGKPAGFSGAVGTFSLAVTSDRDATRVNDAVGLKIKVSGEGSLGSAQAPEIPTLPDFKTLDPKVSSDTSVQADRLRSEKTWDYVVIPLAPGAQAIPALSFSYFDPRAREYRTVSSRPITLQVARGEEGAGAASTGVAQSDVRLLRRDIHFVKLLRGPLRDESRPFYRSPLFLVLLLCPVAADVGAWAWARRRDDSPAAERTRRERRARALARRRFKEARRRLRPDTSRAFYAAVAQALTDYVGDKFGSAGAGLTHQRIEELLAEHGAGEAERLAFHRCLEDCDFARFAPASSDAATMRRVLLSAEETLASLERSLR